MMATKKNEADLTDDDVVDDDAEVKTDPTKATEYRPAPAREMPSAMGATFAERAKARGTSDRRVGSGEGK